MRKIWKILGTIGSFLAGFVLGGKFMLWIVAIGLEYSIPITNEKELVVSFAFLIGMIVAYWWWWYHDAQ